MNVLSPSRLSLRLRITNVTPSFSANNFIFNQTRLYSDMAARRSKRVFTNSKGDKVLLPRLPPALSKVYVPGQMFKYQEAVKKLPVMPLDYIANKYLSTVEVTL